MVSSSYMTAKPRQQSALPAPVRHAVYDVAWPAMMDGAGQVERALYRAGQAARRSPMRALLLTAAAGFLAGVLAWRARP